MTQSSAQSMSLLAPVSNANGRVAQGAVVVFENFAFEPEARQDGAAPPG